MACGKSFRSEAAWDSHERSRKHLKAVEALKREMEQENEELGLAGDEGNQEEALENMDHPDSVSDDDGAQELGSAPLPSSSDNDQGELVEAAVEEGVQEPLPKSKRKGAKNNRARAPSPDVITKSQRRSRKQDIDADPVRKESSIFDDDEASERGPSKREKRRAREAAKKANAKEGQVEQLVCHWFLGQW